MMDMNPSSSLRPLAPALLVGLALGGCLTGNSTIGQLDDTDGSSSGASGDAAESGNEGPTPASSGTDDGSTDTASHGSTGAEPPLPACPAESQCSEPLGCLPEGDEECGGVLGRSDENGCPRPRCDGPGECPAGSSCFLPHHWGTCGHHECADDELGACECGFGLDCNDNGLCVPDELGLPPDTTGTEFCGQHTDAAACEGAPVPAELGTCRWYQGLQVPQGTTCDPLAEVVVVERCVFSKPVDDPIPVPPCPGDPSLTPMAYVDDGMVTVLFVDPAHPPTGLEIDFDADSYGWLTCDQPEVDGECACVCS